MSKYLWVAALTLAGIAACGGDSTSVDTCEALRSECCMPITDEPARSNCFTTAGEGSDAACSTASSMYCS